MKKFNYLLIALILLTGKSIFSKTIKEMWGKDTTVIVDEDINKDGSADIKISVVKEFVDRKPSVNSKQIYKDANIRLASFYLMKNWAVMADTITLRFVKYYPDEQKCGVFLREFKFNEDFADAGQSDTPSFTDIAGRSVLTEEDSKLCKALMPKS